MEKYYLHLNYQSLLMMKELNLFYEIQEVTKKLSIRINELENREIADVIKLSLGNTPQEAKRGETITLDGMATPNTTLTITSKDTNGNILAIDTIQVKFDGKWTYDNLFSPDLELGNISIEIDDGKSKALRNVEVISAKLINISSAKQVLKQVKHYI